MNSSITFPVRPALKLPRNSAGAPLAEEKWASKLAEERRRLEEDQEALRVREENLRNYEAHLRTLQDEIEAGRPAPAVAASGRTASPFVRPSSRAPFDSDAALQVGWEKLHRSRELLESEQTHMRHERVIMQDKENDVKRRERSVADREILVAQRERQVAEAEAALESALPEPIAAEHTMSAVTRLTRAPFDMARSVFSSKK
jgi:hypothetical protein